MRTLPLVSIATGFSEEDGTPAVARGVFAFGTVARGLVAVGAVAVGGVAVGAAAAGVVALGGLSLGLLALGGLALAVLAALGGVTLSGLLSVGGVAVSGLAAAGGWARATYFLSADVRSETVPAYLLRIRDALSSGWMWLFLLGLLPAVIVAVAAFRDTVSTRR